MDFDKILSNIKHNATQIDSFTTEVYFTFDIAKPVDKSALIIESWDDARNARNDIIPDAIKAEEKKEEKSEKSKEKSTKKPQIVKSKKTKNPPRQDQ